MREEFEAWWNLPAQSELRKSCARGWAEVIWQASRAALRVELPTQQGTNRSEWLQTWNNGYNECHQRVTEALQQAGIEVK
ncbi:hypothetical protein DZ907_006800 [Pseudomonas aeruginosa]|nr:hypothetical protein [Pseudomonas aeruginosa]